MLSHVEVLSVIEGIDPPVSGSMVLTDYQARAAAILKYEASDDGRWHQAIYDRTTYLETSAAAMLLTSLAAGVRRGWLAPASTFMPAFEAVWTGIASTVNLSTGVVSGVCMGAGIEPNASAYDQCGTDFFQSALGGVGAVLRACAAYCALKKKSTHGSVKTDDDGTTHSSGVGTLSFAPPTRVFGHGTARTYGSIYADAFYSLVADGPSSSVLFGTPGVKNSTSVLLSENGGETWRRWYSDSYVSKSSGYPFIAVRFNSSALHNLGSACASTKAVPQSSFHASSITAWHKNGPVSHGSLPVKVSFESLPVPLNCSEGGVSADCFWLHAGGTVELPSGGVLMTSAVPWLNGKFGATKHNAGIYAWHSTDGLKWKFRGTAATAAMFNTSGEGPNENAPVLLADGKTLLVVFRIDDGIDGGKVGAKNYWSVRSTDDGKTWDSPQEMHDRNGRGIGVARPRLLMLGEGKGPLLLTGGRLLTEHTRDIYLWVDWDGMGDVWEAFSLSYRHNALVQPEALKFSTAVNSTQGRATTSYTSLLAIDNTTALIVYNGDTGIFSMRVSALGF